MRLHTVRRPRAVLRRAAEMSPYPPGKQGQGLTVTLTDTVEFAELHDASGYTPDDGGNP